MTMNITVPVIGESVSSGTLASWLGKEGEFVKEGQDLFELETDKANLTVPSPAAGVLKRTASEGDEVHVGQVVGVIDTDVPETGNTATQNAEQNVEQNVEQKAAAEGLSPAVRRIVAEEGLPPDAIKGTGKNGRITTEDAYRAVESKRNAAEPPAAESRPDTAVSPPRDPEQTPESPAETGPAPEAVPSDRSRRRVPMTRIRQKIAENLVLSKQSAAHLTTFNEIDMKAVMELRSRYRDDFLEKHGTRLGLMSFFIKACCRALAEYPAINAFVDGRDIVYNDYYDIGVALSTDRGLMTPVVRGADRKSFAAIEAEIVSFAERAKQKKILPDELSGATFTITNGGVFGSLLSTPIPSPPQSGILGMHAVQKRPVVIDDRIEIRPMMYTALTYDHRIVDGREAIGFLVTVKRCIEDPGRLLLDL